MDGRGRTDEWGDRRQRDALGAREPLAMSTTHLQPGGSIDSIDRMHPLVIHDQAFALEQNVQPSITEAGPDRRVGLEPCQHGHAGRAGPPADKATSPC